MTDEKKNENLFAIENFEPQKNLCIEASAGTGKTYTIRKIVAKLVESGVPLSKILLVTYTEKAAGELRDRIRAEMQEGLQNNNSKGKFAKALSEVDTASIGTIHSFCQKTLRDFAYESNVPFALNMVSDDAVSLFMDKLMRDDWAEELAELQKDDSPKVNLKTIQETLANALKNYDGKMEIIIPPKNSDDCLEKNPELKRNWEILQKNEGKNYRAKGKLQPIQVKALVEKIQEKNSSNFTSLGTELKVPTDTPELNEALAYFYEHRQKENLFESDPMDHFVATHIRDAYDKFQRQKLENKQQSFNDMIEQVRDAVVTENTETPTPLCQKLRENYTYAIVDEFQDTNQNQWDIFKTVFLDSSENYIIVVGDPKQSIYSFQGADLEVYKSARNAICQENPYRLATNYRSTNEMVEACNALFSGNYFTDIDFKSSKYSERVSPPKINEEAYKPIYWATNATKENFAHFAVQKILQLMAMKDSKTAFQYFNKEENKHENLRFSHIAVLARTRTELEWIESAMGRAGIPFVRYKDSNLFKGREAFEWITLLKALAAPDFSGKNQQLLKTALVTDFFRYKLKEVDSQDFAKPNNSEIGKFLKWKALLKKRRYAQLQEQIYKDTQIDKYLCEASKLQAFAKIQQIGSYIFDYLYKNASGLDELVKHLEGLSLSKENADDEDGNLVSKGSDFDAVQVMTIHASKGLQFPVVISVAGFTGKNNNAKGPYSYRSESKKFLGFDTLAKQKRQSEETEEWRRLFYVAYTRAESLLVLPYYKKWGKGLEFLNNFQNIDEKFVDSQDLEATTLENFQELKKKTSEILKEMVKGKTETSSEKDSAPIEKLNNALPAKSIYQHSYSSLSHNEKNDSDEVSTNGENSHPDGSETSVGTLNQVSEVDLNPIPILPPSARRVEENTVKGVRNYPKGAKLGNAMHRIFELTDFEKIGSLESAEAAANDTAFNKLIQEEFKSEGFAIHKHADWEKQSAYFVWNTLNAQLPEIQGNRYLEKNFSLWEIPATNRKAEMEFQMNADGLEKNLQNYCKGFIDLLFKRGEYYSILDWKSDVLENYGVGNEEISGTQEKVDSDYAVQRVLYSYCLIQWLKSFYNESEEEIFERHFGGVYYVFFRGCQKDTSFGIYAQTWENFAALKKAFEQVKELMYRKLKNAKNGEEEN